MKLNSKVLIVGILLFTVVGQLAVRAQGPGNYGGGFNAGIRINGAVSALDTTNNLITVQGRGQEAVPTTIKFNNDTKYTKQVSVPLTSLAVGNFISVNSDAPPQPTDTSVDATRITVLPALPPAPANANGGFGGRWGGGRATIGTIATVTPSITITTLAGSTITVNTTNDTTLLTTQSATIADLAVGSEVQISGKTDTTAILYATDVAIQPARQPRPGG